MKRKKFWFILISIVLTVCMLFSIVGCEIPELSGNESTGDGSEDEFGGEEDDNNENDDNNLDFEMPEDGFDTETPVGITLYHAMGVSYRAILDDCIAEFQKLYPNITVKMEFVGNYDDLCDQITYKLIVGEQPNIAFGYSDHVAIYNQSKAVLPLDKWFLPGSGYEDMTVTKAKGITESLGLTQAQVDDYIPAFFDEGATYGDGHTYTLPFAEFTEVLYYNKTFFEEHSDVLTAPDENTTWEDIFETCKKIKEIDSQCTPLGIDNESNLFITLCEQYNSPYTSSTGEHFLFDNESNRGFVQKLKDEYQAGYFTTMETCGKYTSYLFTNEECYMSISSSASARNYAPSSMGGNADFEVGIVSIPQVNPEMPKSILIGPSVCIFKQENPQEVIASWLLAKFLTTDINLQVKYSKVSGSMPVTKSAFDSDVYREFLSGADGNSGLTACAALTCYELSQKNVFYTSPAFFGSLKSREQVGLIIKNVLLDKATIDGAFKSAITECKRYTS